MPFFSFRSHEKWALYWSPLGQCALMVLLMLAFSTILMVLVYIYDWQRRPNPIKELSLATGLYADVYYVDLSATKLITVASLSSSAVLTLMGSFMTLLSYPIAADMIWNSRLSFANMLPNPAQLALLVDLLDGKKMAVGRWMVSVWSGRSAESASLWMIELAVSLQVFITGLCVAIAGVDTWLHLSTDSVTMPYFQPANVMQAGATYQYSRTLYENCWNADVQDLPCSISKNANNQVQIQNQQQIDALLLNATSAATNIYLDESSGYVYLGPPSVQDDSTQNSVGVLQYPQFQASTFAMRTSCNIFDCGLAINKNQSTYIFSCPKGFSRSATASSFEAGPWRQPANDNYTGYTGLARNYSIDTGIEWGVFVHLDDFRFRLINRTTPEYTLNTSTSVTFVLQCNSSLGQSSYSWANNSLTESLAPSVANQTLFDIALGPFLSQGPILQFPSGSLNVFDERLGLTRENTVPGIIPRYEALISGIGLSFLGASVGPAAASSLQLPNSTILTEVPKLPLFTLVALNLWYAGLAICLCILACFLLSRGDQGKDIIAVRKLLSVEGLTQAAVSNHRSIQGEDVRVGVIKRDGQWHFKVWSASGGDEEEGEGLLQPEKDTADTETSSPSLKRSLDPAGSTRGSIKSRISGAYQTLPDEELSQHGQAPVSPVSPVSYNSALFTRDQDERRRISQSLDWIDDER